jgi:DNA repair exonuclease SbcCD ATPase subunit
LETSKEQYRIEKKALKKAQKNIHTAEEAQKLIQAAAQTIQQKAHNQIASVVSKCLETVFDDPYEFHIVFERKRGKTEARLVFVRDGLEISPTTASGGGVVDVAAFALRVACMLLHKPTTRRLIVLDEPFKFVSSEYRPKIRAMLETLATDLKIQFVIVTHITELQVGQVVDLG